MTMQTPTLTRPEQDPGEPDDGEWDACMDDFETTTPDYLDIVDSAWECWSGIRRPHAKNYLAEDQITAEGWYVPSPDLTTATVEEFLDKIG